MRTELKQKKVYSITANLNLLQTFKENLYSKISPKRSQRKGDNSIAFQHTFAFFSTQLQTIIVLSVIKDLSLRIFDPAGMCAVAFLAIF